MKAHCSHQPLKINVVEVVCACVSHVIDDSMELQQDFFRATQGEIAVSVRMHVELVLSDVHR